MSATHQPIESGDTSPEQPQGRRHVAPLTADLLNQVQVCARLGICDGTWMNWRAAGRTPEAVILPSGRRKWRREDIDTLIGKPIERPGRRYFASVRRRSVRHST